MSSTSIPIVSIIANFYNSGKYIPALIESIVSQSFKNWELIAIDDCSPNHDDVVIKKTVKKYQERGENINVTIIRNSTNLGISKAKKVGIDASRGEYILFMDGDDYLAPEALEKLVKPALAHDLDMVIGNHYRVLSLFGIKREVKSTCAPLDKPLTGDELRNVYFAFLTALGINSVAYWAKLYRRKKILSANWNPQPTYDVEDHFFNCTVFPHMDSVMILSEPVYYWRWGGISADQQAEKKIKSFIQKYSELYLLKLSLMKEHAFVDEKNLVGIRLIDYFYDGISKLAKYPASDLRSVEIKAFIHELISSEPYLHLKTTGIDSERAQRIFRGDVDEIYERCHHIYMSMSKRRSMLRILHLMNKIAGIF